MPILFPTTLIQEHEVNPIYEAFKKAGVKFTSEFAFALFTDGKASESIGKIDITEVVAKELEAAGCSVVVEEKQSEPMQECSVSPETYVFPAAYMAKVANALGVEAFFADDFPKKITISLNGKLSTVQVER